MGEAWRDFEREDGDEKSQAEVHQLMPRRVKKRRKIETDDGSDQGWEEYFDYIFPEDEAAKPNLKLLAMAKMWKKNKDVEPAPAEENKESGGEGTEESRDNSEERGENGENEKNVDEDNPDADDPDMANESDSDSSDEEDEP